MSEHAKPGYDAAATTRPEDDLDRWRFAAEIVDVVLETPPEWSARIGVFGKWGEGKSTVLRFAEQMLREKQSIVFWFNPWAIQNWNDLWNDFGDRLSTALSDAGILVRRPWVKIARNLESKKASRVVKAGAAIAGYEKVADAAFGLVGDWLRFDGPQIRAIQEKAKGTRLVVLVDDLDRCAPELLPQLLLSLRELLDLPGFTFLLAFDDEIVGRALKEHNPAWSDGADFLEKILDFRFHLPTVSEKQKQRLVSRALAKYCPFVPMESLKEIQDLLPTNPRKLKTLIRSLAALRPQIVRHGPDEFNWTDMWLAQMLRLESSVFFDQLLSGDRLDREVGTLYRLLRERPKRGFADEGEEKDEELDKLIAGSGIVNAEKAARIRKLVNAARARATMMLRYVCEMAIRPHAVTWKEFDSLFALWQKTQNSATLTQWINEHSLARHVSIEDVEAELFDSIVNRRQGNLESAAESASIPEQESSAKAASLLLRMAEQYLLGLKKLDASAFKKVYGQASVWIGFRKNPADKVLREEEEALLIKLLTTAPSSLSTELFESVYPEKGFNDFPETAMPRESLRAKCLAIVYPKAAEEAIEFFRREGAINLLFEGSRFFAVKCCLFKTDSPIWSTDLKQELIGVIRSGRHDFSVYVNVRDFFRILVQGVETGIDWISREDVVEVLRNEMLVRVIWETITSRGIQYRMQISFIKGRQSFILRGVPEHFMPLTGDLASRLAEEDRKAAKSAPQE
jgi:KAP-like P-loop domain-containing protein